MLSKVSNAYSQRNNLTKLTHYDGTKKRAYDSQIVRPKENLKLSHGGRSQVQSPDESFRSGSSLSMMPDPPSQGHFQLILTYYPMM